MFSTVKPNQQETIGIQTLKDSSQIELPKMRSQQLMPLSMNVFRPSLHLETTSSLASGKIKPSSKRF
jgi:hypothetical protein